MEAVESNSTSLTPPFFAMHKSILNDMQIFKFVSAAGMFALRILLQKRRIRSFVKRKLSLDGMNKQRQAIDY